MRLLLAMLWVCCLPTWAHAQTEPVGRFPIVFHVATQGGEPVLAAAQLESWLATASSHFAAAGVELAPEIRSLPEGWATLEQFRERHALKRFLVPHRINVFVVDRIVDPVTSASTLRAAARAGFVPGGLLAGAHIEAKDRAPRTYVILSARHGSGLSLTHELGHFFGVAHHSDPHNIMSYGAQRTRFDDVQLQTFRRKALRYLRTRELRLPNG